MQKLILTGLILLAASNAGLAHASEVTGTLSNDPSLTSINSSVGQTTAPVSLAQTTTNFATWDIPMAIKIVLVGLLALEVVVLLFLPAFKKKKVFSSG